MTRGRLDQSGDQQNLAGHNRRGEGGGGRSECDGKTGAQGPGNHKRDDGVRTRGEGTMSKRLPE